MKNKETLTLIFACLILLMTATQAWAGETAQAHQISGNVPLDSYVYGYLEKLSGLGYMEVLEGTKPYSRMRVAQWVAGIRGKIAGDATVPGFVENMVAELEKEFAKELVILNGEDNKVDFSLRRLTLNSTYYDGPTLAQRTTTSTYQPLNINNNGYNLADDFNHTLLFEVEGSFANWLLISATPHLVYNDNDDDAVFSYESAYFKTHIGNAEIFYGKDAMAWGQGKRGNLLLSGNSTPQTIFKLSTIDPMELSGLFHFMNGADITFFYSAPESDRTDVRNVNFTGMRVSFNPSSNFTVSVAEAGILGGDGHEIHWDDIGNLITGNNSGNARTDKWDTIAGGDFCWRLPYLNGLQIYGEYYGEDQKNKPIIHPFQNAYIFGFYLPKINSDGDFDLRFEVAKTGKAWYRHGLYREGYTYKDDIIGDAMGNNANRYYLNVTHYFDGAQLGLNLEHVSMSNGDTNPETVNALWLTYRQLIWNEIELETMAGFAKDDNVGFVADESDDNLLLNIGLTKRF